MKSFSDYVQSLQRHMQALDQSTALTFQQLQQRQDEPLPKDAVYVFYWNDEPLYVGRTNRLSGRLKEHGAISSKHNHASFAFLMAKEQAVANGINCKRKRIDLQNCPDFQPHFNKAKILVSEMLIKYTEIEDPIEQTLFEVYAAVELKTPYNKFVNH